MEKIKLLLVDDSILFREVLSKYILRDGSIEIVDKVADPYAARDAILRTEPDVMVLDFEIPRMDGVSFLRKLLPQYYIPTIAISSRAESKDDFISAGAVDFLAKPVTKAGNDIEKYAADLCGLIRKAYKITHPNALIDARGRPLVNSSSAVGNSGLTGTAGAERPEPSPIRPGTVTPAKPGNSPHIANAGVGAAGGVGGVGGNVGNVVKNAAEFTANAQKTIARHTQQIAQTTGVSSLPEAPKNSYVAIVQNRPKLRRSDIVIALGASTGGTEALERVVRRFPEDTPPVVIVQHMPAGFTKLYAERLNRSCAMEVKEAEDGDRLRRGLIIIGAGDFHLRLQKDSRGFFVSSKSGERVSGHCPSVDVLFNSVASAAGPNAIGAILTGMGRDGADGLLAMRQAGAFTIGQDKDSCVVYGMPMEAYKIGAVEVQAPLDKIPEIILGSII